jgi:hypothetical protein
VTAVASGCGSVASPMFGKRLGSPPHEQLPRTSHLRVDASSCIAEWYYFGFASAMFLKLGNFIIYVSLCNLRIHIITLYSGHVYVYYASILRC